MWSVCVNFVNNSTILREEVEHSGELPRDTEVAGCRLLLFSLEKAKDA